ncbi:DUF2946 family protein [Pseudomonas sp. LRF_L74]|uniref:DUF2946 family protein n=1 Tax=Pseudomonas sp. LRF_L74 TaxID=3369422 RepID=UPI003F5F12C3
MKIARHPRSLIAWTLYASVLFSLFVCGIHHGQMGGLALSGLEGGYCGLDSESGHGFAGTDSDPQAAVQLDCSLGSSCSALASNAMHWSLGDRPAGALAPIVARSWAQPPPRYLWPSLNPRASPVAFLAV